MSPLFRELLAARRTAQTPDLAAALQACGLPIANVSTWGVAFVDISEHNYEPVAGGKPVIITGSETSAFAWIMKCSNPSSASP